MLKPFTPEAGIYEPVFRQIAKNLKNRIVSGELADGEQLPPEPELAQLFGTSRPTLRKSLKELEEQQLVVQRKGRGTFVTYRSDKVYRIALYGIRIGDDLFSNQVLAGLHDAFAGIRSELLFLDYDEDRFLKQFHDTTADALVVAAPTERMLIELAQPCFDAIPMVIINAQPGEAGTRPSVDTGKHPLRVAVKHLAELGHRRIGYITLPRKTSNLNDRDRSFLEAVREFGLDEAPELIRCGTGMHYNAGLLEAQALCDLAEPPTAILCPGRAIAFGAWEGLRKRGLEIPSEMSLIGYDIPEWANPYMTTLRQPHREMALTAGKMLLGKLRSDDTIAPHQFDVQLEERGSTAPPPAQR